MRIYSMLSLCSRLSYLLCVLVIVSSYELSQWEIYGKSYDHYHGKYSDAELMADVINNLGLNLLMNHNENNDNNIALSPYGAGVILIALGEGLQGDALYEIRRALNLHYDAHTIRVGLRDIHRHLKSYFIPKEGFLAGITLNNENVTINPKYAQLLRFYGFDIDSFNNAIYPDSHITTESIQGKEETTVTIDDKLDGNTPPKSTEIPEISTLKPIESPSADEEKTTTQNVDEETTTRLFTTKEIEITTTPQSTTNPDSEIILTTAKPPQQTLNQESTTEPITTVQITSAIEERTTISSDSNQKTTTEAEQIFATTEAITENVNQDVSTTDNLIDTESNNIEIFTGTSVPNKLEVTIDSTTFVIPTNVTTLDADSTDETTTVSESEDDSSNATEIIETRKSRSIFEILENQDSINETENTASDVAILSNIRNFDIEINNRIQVLRNRDIDVIENSGNHLENPRKIRSIEEYVIARHYDEPHFHPPKPYLPEEPDFRTPKPYLPDEPPYFLVDGKYKESNLDFMTYDTVLPFLYVGELGAKALAFPLDSDKYYLLLLLPSTSDSLNELICNIRLHNSFKYIINNLELTHVKATIPSFSLRGRITLTNTLQNMGINKIFEPRQADFTPMTSDENIYVTNIEQAVSVTIRNYVDLNRDGRYGGHHQTEPVIFNVNHPFLYFVIDTELEVILMEGKVVNPLNIRIK